MIEKEIFYPAARKADVEANLLDEARVEHRNVDLFEIGGRLQKRKTQLLCKLSGIQRKLEPIGAQRPTRTWLHAHRSNRWAIALT